MTRLHVAVLDDYQQAALELGDWASLPVDVRAFHEHIPDHDVLAQRLAPFDVVVAMRERTAFPAALLARLPRLRLLVTTGASNAAIDVAAAAERGIVVSGTDGLASPAAELTWGLILALARHIPREDAGIRAGGWQTTIGLGLEGAVLGLLGLGRIGARVAAVASAFGMRTLAWSKNLEPERASALGCTAVPLDALLAQADVVSVHVRLSARTHGLLGDRELALMKPTAYLINTSRAEIVDQEALRDALAGGRIAGAGLDVFAEEPLPRDDPLRRLPSTVLTPHVGYVTRQQYELWFAQVVEDVRAYLQGSPIRVIPPA